MKTLLANHIRRSGVEFLVTVPCSEMATVVESLSELAALQTIPVTREDDAVGILWGLELAGRRSLGIFQDSLLGNSQLVLSNLLLSKSVCLRLWLGCRAGRFLEENPAHQLITNRLQQLIDGRYINTYEIQFCRRRKELSASASSILTTSLDCTAGEKSVVVWRVS